MLDAGSVIYREDEWIETEEEEEEEEKEEEESEEDEEEEEEEEKWKRSIMMACVSVCQCVGV